MVQIQLGAQKDEEQAVVQELLADPEQLRRRGSLQRSPHQTVAPTGHRVCATVASYRIAFWFSMFGQSGGFPTRLHGETFPVADWARTCAGVAKHLHPSKATPTRFGRTCRQCALSQSGRSRRVDGENQCISAECTFQWWLGHKSGPRPPLRDRRRKWLCPASPSQLEWISRQCLRQHTLAPGPDWKVNKCRQFRQKNHQGSCILITFQNPNRFSKGNDDIGLDHARAFFTAVSWWQGLQLTSQLLQECLPAMLGCSFRTANYQKSQSEIRKKTAAMLWS